MNEVVEISEELNVVDGNKLSARDSIMGYEFMLSNHPDAVFGDSESFPLKHTFSEGMYVREIFIPKGSKLTGKIHKHEHPNFLMKGKVKVFTEFEGFQIFEAPCPMISKAGTKRGVEALEDTVWITVHHNPTNTTDLIELEEAVIAKDYSEYENFINGLTSGESEKHLSGESPVVNCGLNALKNLSDLKNTSMHTLISMAEDNGLKLYPYKVSLSELCYIPLPAIVHSENHFDYISKEEDFRDDVNYSGNILLTTEKTNYPDIEFVELKNIVGATWVSVGIAGVGLVTTIGGGAIKGSQAKKAQAAANKAQLLNNAVEARKAAQDAKKHKETANTLMIVGASAVILGIGFALYFNSVKAVQGSQVLS